MVTDAEFQVDPLGDDPRFVALSHRMKLPAGAWRRLR